MARRQRSATMGKTGNYRSNTSGRNAVQDNYIYDNTARSLDVRREMEEAPRRRLSNETRKNRDKARHMSLGYVAFLLVALLVAGYVLIGYVTLQADITNKAEIIAGLESELNNLKLSNDEALSKVTSSVDLEEIKRIAIGELGMTYAREGQIETYTNEGNDYMRQVDGD